MSLHETLDLAGRLTLRLHAPDGRVADERVARNDITIHGRSLVARLFQEPQGSQPPRVSRMCVGGSGDPFDPQKNALGALIGCVPIDTVEEDTVTDEAGKPRRRLRITGELGTEQANGELREAGLFTGPDEDDPARVIMYNRVTFMPINKSPEFQLTLVWDILF
ncbi:MAG TPA: hypothetical protein VGX50_10785 [Longimicrobium sp.]|jgi:hypothetical protein|nr:hypothetical protein [Longimicrobium sp.]